MEGHEVNGRTAELSIKEREDIIWRALEGLTISQAKNLLINTIDKIDHTAIVSKPS